MIGEVDRALLELLRARVGAGMRVEVAFEPPTREWSASRNVPTINAYLYDVREDIKRREYGMIAERDETGAVVRRHRPVRHYRLSYLLTCWTKRTEDEHRLLNSVLGCLLTNEMLPVTGTGVLATLGRPVPMTVAEPPEEARSLADIWSALGGNLKPSLDVVIVAPFPIPSNEPVAPPVTEGPGVIAHRTDEPGTVDPLRLRVSKQRPVRP